MEDSYHVDVKTHWERTYEEKGPERVSWFEPVPQTSLALIEEAGIDLDAPVIDVGGGASSLARELLVRSYTDVTVLDISGRSLGLARAELGTAPIGSTGSRRTCGARTSGGGSSCGTTAPSFTSWWTTSIATPTSRRSAAH